MYRSAGITLMWLMCVFSGCGVYISYTTKYATQGAIISVFALIVILTTAFLIRRK